VLEVDESEASGDTQVRKDVLGMTVSAGRRGRKNGGGSRKAAHQRLLSYGPGRDARVVICANAAAVQRPADFVV
jgi:hypothetical protein